MSESVTYVKTTGSASGYVLEALPVEFGNSRRSWLLCWNSATKNPVMIPTGAVVEALDHSWPLEFELVTPEPVPVQWRGSTHSSIAYREVTVEGVTWQVLHDNVGYPWVIQKVGGCRLR